MPMVASMKMNCKYSRPGFLSKVTQPYTCRLHDFRCESPTDAVDEVSDSHSGGKTQADVTSVKFVNSPKMIFFPKGIENFFFDVTHLSVSECGLLEIHQSDLKAFPKLQYLTLYKTKITTLESGLFQFNPKLTKLSVAHCPLKSIAADIFKPTPGLAYVNFHYNACISSGATRRDEIKLVEAEIVKNCPNLDDQDGRRNPEELPNTDYIEV